MRPYMTLTALLLAGASLQAKVPWVKEAQDLGFKDIKSCQDCHTPRMPGLNELGTWLMDEKAKRKAEKIDLMWLAEYPKKP